MDVGLTSDRPVDSEHILLRLDSADQTVAPIPDTSGLLIRTDCERLTLHRLTKPRWARAIGRDHFGLWSEIAVEPNTGEPVIQRLRWIPPGRFLMGSPENEPGRWAAEGPQHPVTISQGYWLFDTPCTQALWQAVMGEKDSKWIPDYILGRDAPEIETSLRRSLTGLVVLE